MDNIPEAIPLSDEHQLLLNELEAYAKSTIENETARLAELIDIVNQSVDIKLVSGIPVTNVTLSIVELEALAMKIPAECAYLQSRMNQYSSSNMFRDLSIEAKASLSLSNLAGAKGTAEERRRQAEMTVLDERLENAVNKLIIKGIQGSIDRADKVYEGVKKVMDFRSKEGLFDRKVATP